MEKTTLKELREGVRLGFYKDVTNAKAKDFRGHNIEKIRHADGVFGMAGGLFIDHTTGDELAVLGRTPILWALS